MALVTVNDDDSEDFRSEPRWSAGKKMDAVLRLWRGESLDALSRELGAEAHRLAAWRDDFLAGGKEGLKGPPFDDLWRPWPGPGCGLDWGERLRWRVPALR